MSMIGVNIVVTGLTGKLLIRWVEASAPLAEVGRSPAYNFPVNVVYPIINLNPVVYIVELWQSVDGVALSQLINSWPIDASQSTSVSTQTYQYQVDRGQVVVGPPAWQDPVNLGDTIIDERLDGATQEELLVQEAGYGPKLNDEYTLLAGGGIVLTNGAKFNAGTGWFITRSLVTTTSTPPSSGNSSNQFVAVQEITGAIDFFTSGAVNLYNKLCPVNGSATIVPVTFLALSLVPNFTRVTFTTHDGTQRYLKLQFNGSDTVSYLGEDVNVIYVGRGAEISLFFHSGKCYVTANDPSSHKVGERFWGDKLQLNSVYRDGTVYNQADVPRLMKFVDSLPPSQIVAEGSGVGQWSYSTNVTYTADEVGAAQTTKTIFPNKGFFARNDIGGTIRVPDDRNKFVRAMKFTDATDDTERTTDLPGGYQIDALKSHNHLMGAKAAGFGFGAKTIPLKTVEQFAGHSGETSVYTTATAGGSETRGENIGQLPLLGI